MPSGNDSSTGIYGVSPYNYLAAQSPVDKHAPQSPLPLLADQRYSDTREEETEEDRQPYSYLNPNAPAPFQRDGSFRPKDFTNRDPETGNAAVNPTYNDRDTASGTTGNAQFYPARRESGDTPQYQSNTARQQPYTIPESEHVYNNYDLKDGKIPRPQVGASSNYDSKPYSSSGFDEPPSSPKSRPMGNEAYLDEHYKNKEEDKSKVLRICGILLLVVLCLGIGFAAGWFASKYLNEDDSSSNEPVITSTMAASQDTASESTTATMTTTTTTTTTTSSATTSMPDSTTQ